MKYSSRQQQLVVMISIFASFVAFLDGFIVTVALPAIERELGGGLITQEWVVNSYAITLGALMLTAGALSDTFGRKKILVVGLVGFGITSLLCAIAPTAEFLIIARGLQGIAGALLVPSSLALIISTISGAAQSKAIGTWTAWTVVAPAIGPLLSGFLADAFSWRLVFWINTIPIAITLFLLSRITIQHEKPQRTSIDYIGTLLCTIGLGALVFALIEQPRLGWQHPLIPSLLVAGILAQIGFLWYEKHAKYPMLPLSLFRIRNFSIGNIATAAIYGALAISTFIITIFIQQAAHFSATQAGLALLPVTILMFVLSRYFGKMAGALGPRLFMGIGPLIMAGGFWLLLSLGNSIDYLRDMLPGIILFGLGLAITVAPLTAAILGAVPKEHSGIGSAINNAVSRIAGLIAIALLSIIVGSHLTIDGYQKSMVFGIALLVVGGVISLIGIRNQKPSLGR